MSDLFSYPTSAGWKGTDTSRDAALVISKNLKALHEKVLSAFIRYGDLTPEEMSERLSDMTLHSVRSRCSELKTLGLLEATGEKRVGASRLKSGVLRIVK